MHHRSRLRASLTLLVAALLAPVLIVTTPTTARAAVLDPPPATTVAVGPTVTAEGIHYEQSGWVPNDDVSCSNTGYLRLNSAGIYTVRDKLRCDFGGNFDYADAVSIRAWGGDGEGCSFSGYYAPEDDVDLDLSLIPVNLHTSEPLDPDCNVSRIAMVFWNTSWTCDAGFENPFWLDFDTSGLCASDEVQGTWALGALPQPPPPVVPGWSGSSGCGWVSGDWTFVSCTSTQFTVTLNSHAVLAINEVQDFASKRFRHMIQLEGVTPTYVPVSPWRTGYPTGVDGATAIASYFDPPYSTPWVAPKSFTFPRPSAVEPHRDLTFWIYEIRENDTISGSSSKRTYRIARVGRMIITKQGGTLTQPTDGDPGASEPPAPVTETDPTNPEPDDAPDDGSCSGFSFTDPTSWAGAGICVLVKAVRSLISAVGGIAGAILDGLAALFIPSTGALNGFNDDVTDAWSGGRAGDWMDEIGDAVPDASGSSGEIVTYGTAKAGLVAGGGCNGPGIRWHLLEDAGVGEGGVFYPMKACTGVVGQAADWVRLFLSAVIAATGLFKIVQILMTSLGATKPGQNYGTAS